MAHRAQRSLETVPPCHPDCRRSRAAGRALRRGLSLLVSVAALGLASTAQAGPPPVLQGTTGGFAVLAGSTITNTGDSVINGDLGLHPGTAVTGFPPGAVNGAQHVTDAVAEQAKTDLVTAYKDAAGRPFSATSPPDSGDERSPRASTGPGRSPRSG